MKRAMSQASGSSVGGESAGSVADSYTEGKNIMNYIGDSITDLAASRPKLD